MGRAFSTGKRVAEKATCWKQPDDPKALLRERKPHTYKFKDDGLIPNHPRRPFIICKSAPHLPEALDPAAVFEETLGKQRAGRYVARRHLRLGSLRSRMHEVFGIARGSAKVQFGGPKGRTVTMKAGDVWILPARSGHKCLKASKDFWS